MNQWLTDLQDYTKAIPFGEVSVTIVRHKNQTAKLMTVGAETLHYVDNNEAVKDLLAFITSLIDDKHSGSVEFKVALNNGQIDLLTIKNSRITNY